ncbi:hypothetical protein [Cyanobium sp. NIES-981]|uniref:hypothetical protein n=1 Tax=Cyanobium sp. NIES-981 TaxID=1851505 RepID=UPI0007DDBFEC|nr:hypothetical protein [Cyanobium sp. NIES-981]SBO44747.1 conserved protein of unknown function [Cyanobium sp. NIES-981]
MHTHHTLARHTPAHDTRAPDTRAHRILPSAPPGRVALAPARAGRRVPGAGATVLLGLLACWSVLGVAPAEAAVMGGARVRPYAESVQATRKAAEAVLARSGAESCLRGKLTNALLGLSASCGASGERNALCQLADQAVVQLHWPLSFMDDTARRLLELIAST